ncbi:Golgi CORVET complex core vacuolar protein 8-domain-containing protein [Mycena floridula]|nr:Golgi CORVET complex core vacuolar protein 8-domain-containing protein [Mycena floridula]
MNGHSSRLARPFIHPTISRLRSITPQPQSLMASTSSLQSHNPAGSPSQSHFSGMSRRSSISNFHALSSSSQGYQSTEKSATRQVFRWTNLRNVGQQIYTSKAANKASSILGAPTLGSPTVLAANGLICVGTDEGKICVYDFKQTLICICGNDSSKTFGSVTALALSFDHTFVAAGHSTGHIQLYNIKNPLTPARAVAPITLTAVSTGRKEGHILGSRIVNIGFIAGRHTAIVSADENGLAFYHSLGKVLFVEAPDILRILGKYQPDIPVPPSPSPETPITPIASRRKRPRYTVLAMSPLPLGTASHPTDQYNIIALLTPTKLVVVALKPAPKTWFKYQRDIDAEGDSKPKSRKGALSWFPSILPSPDSQKQSSAEQTSSTTPRLAFTWGRMMYIIHVSETKTKHTVKNSRTGKSNEVDVGVIGFEKTGTWSAEEDILAIQWLNVNQIVVLTASTLEVYDARLAKLVEKVPFDGLSLISPILGLTVHGFVSYADSVAEVSHSLRVYKGKIFILGREKVQVGTLLSWADRILESVQDGDFLSAIELARTYYTGDFKGNSNGLPDDPQLRRDVVGQKIHELMVASARYAFSEDRMTDGTHVTPDGRGVDRTSLFEGLVATCARACVALDDFEFLFEDLFQQYDDSGITSIFLLQLEKFVLDNEIRYVPPRITQRLIALHADEDRPDLVERIIWHMDPTCLDINQAIHLCQKHQLYDALIYVYTRALKDYVAPVVELLGLIRKVRQFRIAKMESFEPWTPEEDAYIEPLILNSYKIYPYLANVLSGLTYPSEEPLEEEEAFQAKKDVYTFLFFGRSSMWPAGEGGKLVLTADEEGGVEPTYPYTRQLLRFDSESFLHSLDISFEDAYLNDESQGVSRLVIVRILTEILGSATLPPSDVTFVNIFIARNVPKYPQFLHITPSILHGILIGLAEDSDANTREDRQLAAEYLLSVYNPHESDHIMDLFKSAGFYRILRSWHRQERKWAPLLTTYLDDPSLRPLEMFESVNEVLTLSTRSNKGKLPVELIATVTEALPQLLQASVSGTASIVDVHLPDLHDQALNSLPETADNKRYIYLRHLLGPPRPENDEDEDLPPSKGPSRTVPSHLRQLFVSLQCQYHPKDVISVLQYLPPDMLDWTEVVETCESHDAYEAVVWALDWRDDPLAALSKAETFEQRLTLAVVDSLSDRTNLSLDTMKAIRKDVEVLDSMGRRGIELCLKRSQGPSAMDIPLEDIWFQLLSSQLNSVQNISECCSEEALLGKQSKDEFVRAEWHTISTLRSLVQSTFSALVSITSTRAVSFPRLFKRLVDSTNHATGSQYFEFRTILTGMLESYRSDGDILIITKHLVERDLFDTVAGITRERAKGWGAAPNNCSRCRKPLFRGTKPETIGDIRIEVSRTSIHHSVCPLES